MAEGKFFRVDQHLRFAVGLEIPDELITRLDRLNLQKNKEAVVETRPSKKGTTKVYLSLDGTKEVIRTTVPREFGGKAPWGEIILNDNHLGALVTFGRQGEELPFGPKEKGGYVFLRLYRENEHPFNPVYVRVDEGQNIRFFVLRARWCGDTITIEVEHSPVGIPDLMLQ